MLPLSPAHARREGPAGRATLPGVTIETSPEDFVQRHRAHAATGTLYAQPEGSPLMEFSSGGRVLYLLDRSGPYAVRPGPARVLVSGVLQQLEAVEAQDEQLSVLGVSAVEGVGVVVAAERGTLVVRARLPLVLSGARPLPEPGAWVRFTTDAPLHGFLL